jgi:hypothetical protein
MSKNESLDLSLVMAALPDYPNVLDMLKDIRAAKGLSMADVARNMPYVEEGRIHYSQDHPEAPQHITKTAALLIEKKVADYLENKDENSPSIKRYFDAVGLNEEERDRILKECQRRRKLLDSDPRYPRSKQEVFDALTANVQFWNISREVLDREVGQSASLCFANEPEKVVKAISRIIQDPNFDDAEFYAIANAVFSELQYPGPFTRLIYDQSKPKNGQRDPS